MSDDASHTHNARSEDDNEPDWIVFNEHNNTRTVMRFVYRTRDTSDFYKRIKEKLPDKYSNIDEGEFEVHRSIICEVQSQCLNHGEWKMVSGHSTLPDEYNLVLMQALFEEIAEAVSASVRSGGFKGNLVRIHDDEFLAFRVPRRWGDFSHEEYKIPLNAEARKLVTQLRNALYEFNLDLFESALRGEKLHISFLNKLPAYSKSPARKRNAIKRIFNIP